MYWSYLNRLKNKNLNSFLKKVVFMKYISKNYKECWHITYIYFCKNNFQNIHNLINIIISSFRHNIVTIYCILLSTTMDGV